MKKNLFSVHKWDARNIDQLIKEKIVDTVITSPPYFDMKDYGYKEQIGFGQSYEQYLKDLGIVFQKVFNCVKDSGTLWVVIDALRKDGEIITLPFDLANEIKKAGWIFKEIIIWEKDRTVPWTHKGQMRNSFEYILLFSKTNEYKFYIDRIRDFDVLKKWWVKYPERYNPKGKTPDGIWHFPIPLQGSWGNGYIRHFCPLPEGLVERILTLSTDENDVVLDPFSGSGTVLAKAKNMKRKYIGTELNSEYIKMFENYLIKTSEEKEHEYEQDRKFSLKQKDFENLILELRILKYARILLQKLRQEGVIVKRIYADKSSCVTQKKNSLSSARYILLLDEKSKGIDVNQFVLQNIIKAPLSKYGIEPKFSYIHKIEDMMLNTKQIYTYSNKATHKFIRSVENLRNLTEDECILSPIKVNLDEKDFEDG